MYRASFRTFGCKLNQLETESLADAFARAGAIIVGPSAAIDGSSAPNAGPSAAADSSVADLYILNTCTVTGKAEQKARHAIRSALGSNPGAVVVVTGCYAQVDAAALEAIDPRVISVRGEDKARLHALALYLGEEWQGHGSLLDAVREWASREPGSGADRFAFSPESFTYHSRPSLKIEDGCDNHCSYCRVCIARGPAESLAAPLVLERLLALEAAGAAEVVLAGVNLSQYRSDGLDFGGLLRYLLAGSSRVALRLSSYEPDRVDASFLEAFAAPRVRPHVHLAIQSGSDPVLARMGRRYKGRRILEACEDLRRVKGDPFLAADIIAGFPGEGEEEFGQTMAVAREAGFAWIHAFPFSARPGTAAFGMKPKVPERISGERVAALTNLAHSGREAYIGRWTGAEVRAVVEGSCGEEGGPANPRPATSENYLKLGISGEGVHGLRAGTEVSCLILPPLPGADFDAPARFMRPE
jgi:threonylcarbamoyladenosine tRNA methylthiotransferase MtaB